MISSITVEWLFMLDLIASDVSECTFKYPSRKESESQRISPFWTYSTYLIQGLASKEGLADGVGQDVQLNCDCVIWFSIDFYSKSSYVDYEFFRKVLPRG